MPISSPGRTRRKLIPTMKHNNNLYSILFLAGSIAAAVLVMGAMVLIDQTTGLHDVGLPTGTIDLIVAAILIGGGISLLMSKKLLVHKTFSQGALRTHLQHTALTYLACVIALIFLALNESMSDLRAAYILSSLCTFAVVILANAVSVLRKRKEAQSVS